MAQQMASYLHMNLCSKFVPYLYNKNEYHIKNGFLKGYLLFTINFAFLLCISFFFSADSGILSTSNPIVANINIKT